MAKKGSHRRPIVKKNKKSGGNALLNGLTKCEGCERKVDNDIFKDHKMKCQLYKKLVNALRAAKMNQEDANLE